MTKRNLVASISLLVFASVVPLGAERAAAQPPVVRYAFDEEGGIALDTGSGEMSNGVLGPDAARTDNTPGGFSPFALDLRAAGADSNLFVGPSPEVNGLEQFTMTTWLYLEGLNADQGGSGNVRLLANQAGGEFDGFSWNLNSPNEGERGVDNFRMGMFVGGENSFEFGQSLMDVSADNQWTFLAVTYDGNESVDNLYFYAGDESVSQSELIIEQLGDPLSLGAGHVKSTIGTANFGIGLTDAAPGLDFAAVGFQDDVRVYDRVLSIGELEAVRLENLISDVTCDFDGDGVCSVADLDELLSNLGGPNSTYNLDSADDNITLGDRDAWLTLAGQENIGRSYLDGDADLDGDVDAADLNNLGVAWLTTDNPSWQDGDFNGDGTVDATDLNSVGLNWQQGVAPAAASAVPEPGSFCLLLSLMVLTFVRGRKR